LELQSRSTVVGGESAEADTFDIVRLLQRLQLEMSETVLLNWHQYDDVDEMRAEDLRRHFDDIWYPSSDDLDIIDAGLGWIISVRHDGVVHCLDFSKYN
jgi:hypothetical protein